MTIFINTFLVFLVILFQSIFPVITYGTFEITPDFLLIFFTLYSLRNERIYCVIFGFIIGFFQDLISQIDLIGAFAFVKSLSGFMLSSLKKYLTFFSRKIVLMSIFCIYIIHFSIFYFLRFNDVIFDLFLFIKIIVVNSFINIVILILIDKILFDSKLIHK